MLQFRPESENYTLLFTLAASSAAVELGLTAYLMIAGSHVGGVLYHSLFVLSPRFVLNNGSTYCRQIIFLLDALWTVLFLPACVLWFTRGSLDLLANIFGSIFWVFAAAFVWVSFSNAMSYPMSESCVAGLCNWVGSQHKSKEEL